MRYRRPKGFAANISVHCGGDTDSPSVMLLQHKPGNIPANSTERSHSFNPTASYDVPQNPARGSAPRLQPSLPGHAAAPRARAMRLRAPSPRRDTALRPTGTARSRVLDVAGAVSMAPRAGLRD